VDSGGHTKRIDRIIVRSGEVLIVDYKSSKDDAFNYEQQVREYMSIAGQLYPSKTIRGFLLYLDSHNAEEING